MTPAPADTFDVIALDVLLYRLGGFADPPDGPTRGNLLPDALWARLEALARLPRARRGELVLLGEQYHRSPGALTVHLHKLRHGRRPRYREAA